MAFDFSFDLAVLQKGYGIGYEIDFEICEFEGTSAYPEFFLNTRFAKILFEESIREISLKSAVDFLENER